MKRLPKVLLPTLILVILAEVALVRLGFLDLDDAVLIVVAVEVLLLVVGGTRVLSAVREYRRNRAGGLDVCRALEGGAGVLLPWPAARLLVSELRLFYCLVKWLFRHARLREGEFSYHKRSIMGAVVLMVVFVTPVEVLVIEVLLQAFLPLIWLRVLLFFLAVYAVFWLIGSYAARVVLPHRLETTGLRLQYGIFAEAFVPYDQIKSVDLSVRKAPKWGDGLQITDDKAYLAISGKTDVTLELRSPISLQSFLRPTAPMGTVHLAADEPKALTQKLEHRLRRLTLKQKVAGKV